MTTEPTATMNEGPTLSAGPRDTGYEVFAKAVVDANGKWVEMQIVGKAVASRSAIERHLVKYFTEITIRDGVVYSRVKK